MKIKQLALLLVLTKLAFAMNSPVYEPNLYPVKKPGSNFLTSTIDKNKYNDCMAKHNFICNPQSRWFNQHQCNLLKNDCANSSRLK